MWKGRALSADLFKHQEAAAAFVIGRGGSGAVFHEIGLGKTRTALEIFSRLREKEPALKLLVICPLSLLEAAWADDIKKFTGFSYLNCHKFGIPVDLSLVEKTPIFLINYESFITETRFKQIYSMLCRSPFLVVCDESSRLKNAQSVTVKRLIALRDRAKYRVVMSGTPAPNTELEYWGQMEFVSRGALHPSFYAFRNSFFHLERKGQRIEGRVPPAALHQLFRTGAKYVTTNDKRQKLMAVINKYSHWAKKRDCLDLPEQIDAIRKVQLPALQAKAYRDMKTEYIAQIQGREIAALAALTKIMKLREITSGFIMDEYEACHAIGQNEKLEELCEVIEEAGDQQIIIWGHFTWEIEQIEKRLTEEFANLETGSRPVAVLYGKTKDREDEIARFLDGRARFLVAHPLSAGHGLTFVNSSLEIFFSLSYSWEQYEQCRGRIHRYGQKNPSTYIHLLAEGTVDEDLYETLRTKGDAQEILYKMIRGGR